ncbi:MAG: GNAT family N-acetyltransferase [Cytophagaceae bacterium]|nr:GNAT family N-acetyltransferase [Gemmatimonadaceae bacterium]
MELQLPRLTIRSWRVDDAESLAPLANNYSVWRNLRDRFPHPYTADDARAYIERTLARTPQLHYAIALEDAPIGSIGVIPGEDIYRKAAEFGYWLGEPYWGRGFASEAIVGFSDWAFGAFDLVRLNALVFTWNPASARALEKGGFVLEATSRCAAIKEGKTVDEWLYAKVRAGISTGDAC